MNNIETSTHAADKAVIMGVPFSCCSMEDVLEEMRGNIAELKKPQTISITNTESAFYAARMQDHMDYVRQSSFSCCDGVAVVLIGKIRGLRIPRLYGPDLMLRACAYGVRFGWRHYFYGGREGVAEVLSKKLTERFPGLITAGMHCPPFRQLTPEEDAAVIQKIRNAQPDIVWVGLGLLKQERWIADHLKIVGAPWMVGVGAAFDFHAGTAKRPPAWLSKAGLEWLYRLFREPRMFVRNLRSFDFFLKGILNALRYKSVMVLNIKKSRSLFKS